MRMHRSIAAVAALSLAASAVGPVISEPSISDEFDPRYRSKRSATKAKRKPNRNHISRRVRRKHRRARAAS
jgi:hypothetical protein